MIAKFEKSKLSGDVYAPSSKSISHRLLICTALSKKRCVIDNVLLSEDILATIDCLKALGAKVTTNKATITIDGSDFLNVVNPVLNCRESGSTLRFFIPIALLTDKDITFTGSQRLFERPLDVYEQIAKDNDFIFEKGIDSLRVKGKLKPGEYIVKGNISSQFISGLMFALSTYHETSKIKILPPIESKSYIDLTISSFNYFGIYPEFINNDITISNTGFNCFNGSVEADESNAAFLDAFNYTDGNVKVLGLNKNTLQGDRVYHALFPQIKNGHPTIDLADCPDLGPVLMALASLNNGAEFIHTSRLKAKECDRGLAMKLELEKAGCKVVLNDDSILVSTITKTDNLSFHGHNDHRIVMALSLILLMHSGTIDDADAVNKSFPDYFDKIIKLNGKVDLL